MGKGKAIHQPDEAQAREAVRTLIRWAGDDPDRPGLADTPTRVLAFYREFFTGYGQEAGSCGGGFADDAATTGFILVRDIKLESFCEHHMLPATGRAHIAYVPDGTLAGIGSIARIAAGLARRLTVQERLGRDIAEAIEAAFSPRGVAVLLDLSHGCMTLRGGRQDESRVVTIFFSGVFRDDRDTQKQFLSLIGIKAD